MWNNHFGTIMRIIRFVLIVAFPLLNLDCSVHAQTSMDIAPKMMPGWNLGNTLEAGPCTWLSNKLDWETGWQPTKTTQSIINSVKEAGFNAVRIPCAWDIHSDSKGKIDVVWMARVKKIVDYCMNAGL